MFSQTPERQAATQHDANPLLSAAKVFTEVGKAVIERSLPAPALVAPTPAVIDLTIATPAAPDGVAGVGAALGETPVGG